MAFRATRALLCKTVQAAPTTVTSAARSYGRLLTHTACGVVAGAVCVNVAARSDGFDDGRPPRVSPALYGFFGMGGGAVGAMMAEIGWLPWLLVVGTAIGGAAVGTLLETLPPNIPARTSRSD